jgi:hypothetical protein
VVAQHLHTFLEQADQDASRPGLPRFVRRELTSLLDCGILARGFLRVELLVAFSCKGRGFCPSCGGRRMADTAAHLVDAVLCLPKRLSDPSSVHSSHRSASVSRCLAPRR